MTYKGKISLKPLLSSVTECNDPGLSGTINYGNGLLHLTEKRFCAHGICQDLNICRLISDTGEESYYLPVGPGNISRNNGGNPDLRRKGSTAYDAIRIIQNDDGLFLKLNDATFSRTECAGNYQCDGWFRTGSTEELLE